MFSGNFGGTENAMVGMKKGRGRVSFQISIMSFTLFLDTKSNQMDTLFSLHPCLGVGVIAPPKPKPKPISLPFSNHPKQQTAFGRFTFFLVISSSLQNN